MRSSNLVLAVVDVAAPSVELTGSDSIIESILCICSLGVSDIHVIKVHIVIGVGTNSPLTCVELLTFKVGRKYTLGKSTVLKSESEIAVNEGVGCTACVIINGGYVIEAWLKEHLSELLNARPRSTCRGSSYNNLLLKHVGRFGSTGFRNSEGTGNRTVSYIVFNDNVLMEARLILKVNGIKCEVDIFVTVISCVAKQELTVHKLVKIALTCLIVGNDVRLRCAFGIPSAVSRCCD